MTTFLSLTRSPGRQKRDVASRLRDVLDLGRLASLDNPRWHGGLAPHDEVLTMAGRSVTKGGQSMAADGKGAPIFVLDDDRDLVDSMVAVVENLSKRRCITATSFDEMVGRSPQVLLSGLAFLDINLGADKPSGLEAYRWLKKQKYGGKIVFFTGHAQSHPQVQEAARVGKADVIRKPVSVDTLLKLIGS